VVASHHKGRKNEIVKKHKREKEAYLAEFDESSEESEKRKGGGGV